MPRPIYLISGGSNCDITFGVGQRYLVFRKWVTGGIFETSHCAGTVPVPDAIETLARLRTFKKAHDQLGDR